MSKKLRAWLIFLIFINGLVSLSLELVVLRQLSFYVGSSAVITSIIMGTFLGFMSLGYFMGGARRVRDASIRITLGISFLCIALFAVLAASFPLITKYFVWMYRAGITSGALQTAMFSILLLSAGPFLFGFNTTLLSRALHKYNTNYTGNIMAWDTIGSVMGSLATTLILMPFIGVNYTVVMIVILACVSALIAHRAWWVWVACTLIIVPTLYINSNAYQHKKFGIIVNNANSTISVNDYGDMRVLNMNGLPMSLYHPQTNQSADYINYVNDNFIYNMPRDRRYKILVLGAGGFTAGLNDDFHDYTFVDIERTLKNVSEEKFLNKKLTPNKKFIVQDASQYLKNTPEQYDLIILDVYSNSFQVPEGLITAEFMTRLKSRIAPNGIIVMNMIVSPSFDDAYTRVFDNTFHAVFPHNTTRQVIGWQNPWGQNVGPSNVIYAYYNRDNDGHIYTINKTPVIYDRY